MKYFLIILFFLVASAMAIGFYVKVEDESAGKLMIGLSLMVGFFILMPLFIYHRWKNKDVKDYMLNKENIMKMHDYQNKKD